MGNPFLVVLAVVGVLLTLLALYGLWVLWDEGERALSLVGLLLLVGIAAAVGAGWWFESHASDGSRIHRWLGGDGPDTECYYSVDQGQPAHMVGKVMVPATDDEVYTECREHRSTPR